MKVKICGMSDARHDSLLTVAVFNLPLMRCASAGYQSTHAHSIHLQGIVSCQGALLPFCHLFPVLSFPATAGILTNLTFSSTPQIEENIKRQLQWFFRVQGGQAAGGASAGAPINSQDIAEGAFFGFGPNERDDLLHMYAFARYFNTRCRTLVPAF